MTRAEVLADLKARKIEKQSALKAIRAKCMDCSVYQINEVSACVIPDCSLYPFRMGKNPWGTRKGNTDGLVRFRSAKASIDGAREN